jgi:biotin transport system permease protein
MLTLTSERETPLHHLPAGGKLGALAVFGLGVFLLPIWGAGLGLLGLGVLAGGIGLWHEWRRLFRPLFWMGAVILLWHGVTGTLAEGATVVLRMGTAFGAANLVTLTTRLTDLQAVFLWLARPLAPILPPGHLALAMALVIRFVPVLALRAGQLSEAWAARSRRRLGWPLIFAITLAALDDAEHVAEALRARGGLG